MVNTDYNEKFIKYLEHYKKSMKNTGLKKDYSGHIKRIEKKLNMMNNSLVSWITTTINHNSENPILDLLKEYDDNDDLKELGPDCRSGFRKFAQSVIGIFYANTWLTIEDGQDKFFCELIAKNAIFASKEVVDRVKKGELGSDLSKDMKKKDPDHYNNENASWDYMVHYRDNKKAKERLENRMTEDTMTDYKYAPSYKIADSNNIANYALKQAILISYPWLDSFAASCFKDYEVCHVWDKPTDRRYYASIKNLVLMPRALAQLTDHNEEVKALLRRRAYELFNKFVPKGEKVPKSTYYKDCENLWRKI